MPVRLTSTILQPAIFPVQEVTFVGETNGPSVEVANLNDMGKIVLMAESVSGAGRTLDARIQDAVATGGPFADAIPAVAFAQIGLTDDEEAINIYLDGLREFMRIVITLAGTSPVYRIGCILLGRSAQDQ